MEPTVGYSMVEEDMAELTAVWIVMGSGERSGVWAEAPMSTAVVAEERPRGWRYGGSSMPTKTLAPWKVWAVVEGQAAFLRMRASRLGELWESLVVSRSPLEKQELHAQRCAPI